MSKRQALTDRKLKSLKSLKSRGKRYDVWDGLLPGFAARVMESGRISFILVGRYPGRKNPTRRIHQSLRAVDGRRTGSCRRAI